MKSKHKISSDEVIIIDFETTGLSANYDRIIEVGAAVIKNNKVVKTFSKLCNPGFSIPYFITEITGINNSMLKGKPSPENVMPKLYEFIDKRPILAHNASFDSQFLSAEMERVQLKVSNPILCTMLLSRRIILNAVDHKLSTLKKHIKFKSTKSHQDHRALDDVKVTAELWFYLKRKIENKIGVNKLNIDIFQKISKTPKSEVQSKLHNLAKKLMVIHE